MSRRIEHSVPLLSHLVLPANRFIHFVSSGARDALVDALTQHRSLIGSPVVELGLGFDALHTVLSRGRTHSGAWKLARLGHSGNYLSFVRGLTEHQADLGWVELTTRHLRSPAAPLQIPRIIEVTTAQTVIVCDIFWRIPSEFHAQYIEALQTMGDTSTTFIFVEPFVHQQFNGSFVLNMGLTQCAPFIPTRKFGRDPELVDGLMSFQGFFHAFENAGFRLSSPQRTRLGDGVRVGNSDIYLHPIVFQREL